MTDMINNATSSDIVAAAGIASTLFDAPSQRKKVGTLFSKRRRLISHGWHSPSPNKF